MIANYDFGIIRVAGNRLGASADRSGVEKRKVLGTKVGSVTLSLAPRSESVAQRLDGRDDLVKKGKRGPKPGSVKVLNL